MKKINIMETEKMQNIAELKGLLADARRRELKFVILPIPVRLLTIDTAYQTPIRTERDLNYITKNFDERKIGVLWGVPHYEEGLIYLVDGYGRKTASQLIDPEKYKELNVLILLDFPEDPKERQKFEAEIFISQGNNKKVTPLQKHGARQITDDPVVKAMDMLQEEYKFVYSSIRGKRGEGVIGSYTELYKSIKVYGYAFGEYFFDIARDAGLDRKSDGYAVYILRSIKDLYKLYPESRDVIKKYLGSALRNVDYRWLHSKANAKYELLGPGNAMTMFFEDMVVENTGLRHVRKIDNNKIVDVA